MKTNTQYSGPAGKTVSWLVWLVIIANWIIAISRYSTLPEQVPTHFDFSGKPDNYGNRATIFVLPLISTVLSVWLTGLKAGIGYLHFAVKGDPGESVLLTRVLNLAIAIILLVITINTISVATGKAAQLGSWFLPFTILVIAVPVMFFVIRNFRKSRS